MTDPLDPSSEALIPEANQEIAPGVYVNPRHLRMQFSRGSGPGGQNVNKVNTKAEIWIPLVAIAGMSPSAIDRLRTAAGRRITAAGEIHLISEIHRTQEANRQEVFARLREMIVAAQVQPRKRRKTKPSAASRRRRLESKHRRSEIKAGRRDKFSD